MSYTEEELVAAIRAQSPAAFEQLIQEYSKPVYYLAHNILGIGGSKEDIEECVSDVFVQAWQKIDRFDREKGSLRTWLLMLTKYQALAYKRRLERNPADPVAEEALAAPVNVEKQVIDRETQQLILQTIQAFGEVDRQLFIRRYIYDESIPCLMTSMGLSRSAIDNRLLRGRNKIKEALSYG